MDTQDIALVQMLLDHMYGSTATVDMLVLVVLPDTVRVVAIGVEHYPNV